MKLTLLSKQDYSSITLPEKFAGHYRLRARTPEGKMSDIVAVEALRPFEAGGEAGWILKPNRRFKIFDRDGDELREARLKPFELYKIRDMESMKYVLYAERASEDRKHYRCYEIQSAEEVKLTIGRSPENNICYINEFVSGRHAELTLGKSGASLSDLSSANGTYVNGKAVKNARLNAGDAIYIMGLQIITANRLLFFNNPDGNVKIQSANLREYRVSKAESGYAEADGDDYEDIFEDYYYRAPRFVREADTFELKLDAPPSNQSKDEMPMAMVLGPSLTMGMASAVSGSFALTNAIGRGDMASALPSVAMSFSMLLGTLMWPLLTKTFQRRSKKRKEALRQKTYMEYLSQMQKLAEAQTERQKRILRENDPGPREYAKRILAPLPQIWERTPKHSDFLTLRLGTGDLPLKANIQYPERKFTAEPDNLALAMYSFGEQERRLCDVPICLPLAERFVSGIYGPREFLIPYARSLILQTAALHGYDEVKLALIYDERDADAFAFARWLPHTMDDGRKVRYIASGSEETKQLSGALDAIIEYRKTLGAGRLEDESPYFVIICLDKELASKTECVRRIQEHKSNIKFSVLSMFERLKDLPKECSAAAELCKNQNSRLTLIGNPSELPVDFIADAPPGADIQQIVKVLANTEVDLSGSNFKLPKKYTFFEMLGIGRVEHLNLTENWAANDPTESLAACVGVDRYGEPFKLDLHERSHGPHGLVAGMTGSGKSEFIIAYILSMAVSFHPHEVSFILIDYKGGGMAKSFENIPHTAGVITNLDGNKIKRSLVSMHSELHRRERIFRDISKQHGISNIDIYKYQKLYREGKVGEALPHLFIVSDEFAELKKEQPDFMTELTSTARVGRSLGVHLILATQKPGGVVDDQIRSNSRFRICLKVQDNGDSMEMLGRPEAAALVDTGRFYLQVGYSELFEIGQSAWAGAPYYPSPKVIRDRDDAVAVIGTNGRIIAEANTNRFAAVKDPPKQLDVLTGYIAKICEEENITGRKMWLDPIPGQIHIDGLEKKYPVKTEKFVLEPVVGEIDDPAAQSQQVLRVPITTGGNVIIYGSAGNGKAMFVEAVCYSLIKHHAPEEVSIYIMDFGAETLSAFRGAPHVGDVVLSYETEKVNNLFKLMLKKLETRKKLLSQFGGDMAAYNRQSQTCEPVLAVIINNYAAFTELFEDKAGEINYLTREGAKYGIYFILTCTGVNNVKFGLLQNFKSIYCLQLNNPGDYSSAVGKTDGATPEKHKGRGLWRRDKDSLLEFQTAALTDADSAYDFIRGFCSEAAAKHSGAKAAAVPVLPEKVTAQFLAERAKPGDFGRVPIGVEKETLEISYYDFTAGAVCLILSVNQEWQDFTGALGALLAGFGARTKILSPAGKTQNRTDAENLRIYSDAGGCVEAVYDIFALVLARNNEYKDKLAAGGDLPDFEPVFVIIQSIALLKTMLESYRPAAGVKKETGDDAPLARLQLAMEKCSAAYGVYFIVAESLNSLTPFSVEGWYKTHINGSSGIWAGSGANAQYRLTINKKPANFPSELESDFGFAVNNASATLIKLLQ
ncbi:MAG: type VII secretion protein EssC [Oscillospiraceae bacterium]|nr:type VII secretion protein EssC [Oscillospiraceae bacterium]